jgi:hypothetical protein
VTLDEVLDELRDALENLDFLHIASYERWYIPDPEEECAARGRLVYMLGGDPIRLYDRANLGFCHAGRHEHAETHKCGRRTISKNRRMETCEHS